MRLWTLHPAYLDARGLVALWREGLLAQAVLAGKTRGYVNHPQLLRFRQTSEPQALLCDYLREVHAEAGRRGYRFAAEKLDRPAAKERPMVVTRGQLAFEWQHLMAKLAERDPARRERLRHDRDVQPHPLFTVVDGGIEDWEKGRPAHDS